MKLPLVVLTGLALLVVPPRAVRAAGGELQGAVNVSGREVEVRLRHPDSRPAAEVQVRLLYAGKRAVAAGHTDGQGRWAHTVERTGSYEVLVEGGPDGQETLRLPFTVLDTPPARPVSWGAVVTGLA